MNKDIPLLYVLEEDKNIFDTEKKFEIPLYQREFAWEYKHITALIDDINDFEGSIYYIGSLIISESENSYEIIDGQQRLTALYLILNYLSLYEKTKNLKIQNTLKYSCRDKSNYTLKNIKEILLEKKDLENELLEDNIINAIDIIKQYFKSKNITISHFLNNIKKVVVFKITVPKDTDLNRYFEIMNTRGEQLEQTDIIKATLMSYLQNEDANLFATIWNICSDMNGYVQMNFKFIEVNEKKKTFNRSILVRSSVFGKSWNEMPPKEWSSYIFINKYQKIAKEDDDEFYEKYYSIIDFSFFLLHCLKSYLLINTQETSKVSLDDKLLLKSFNKVLDSYNSDKEKENFSKAFIIHLLRSRFLFDKYVIKRYRESPEDNGEWRLQEIKENDGKKQPSKTSKINQEHVLMLQAALRVSYTAPKNMNWITTILTWLSNSDNLNKLDNYEHIIETIIIEAINKNFFSTPSFSKLGVATPHIVFNYLDYLIWKDNEKVKFDFEFRNSVEHWYPQKPSEDTFEKWNEVDRFGNLCIIQRNINSRFSNKSPESKMQDHKPMIEKGSLKLREMSKLTTKGEYQTPHENWMKKTCELHESKMLKKLFNASKNYKFLTEGICDFLLKEEETQFEQYNSEQFKDFKILKLSYNDIAFIYFSTNNDKNAFEIGFCSNNDFNEENAKILIKKLRELKISENFCDMDSGFYQNWIYRDFTIKDIVPIDISNQIKELLFELKQ